MITPEQEEKIFEDIWRDAITVFALPLVLFTDTFQELEKALFRGFGAKIEDFSEGSKERILLTKLRENLNRFSAAKTFQNVRDTVVFRLDEGRLRPFNEFIRDAKKIFNTYNDTWLKVEFDTAVAQAQSADQWIDIQRDKDVLPLLKYQTAGDNRVRPEHASWDGIVKPVDDPFWDTHTPPNDWGCVQRCFLIQLKAGEEKVTSLKERLKKVKKDTKGEITTLENTSGLFSNNPGKDQFIFKETKKGPHPYFLVPKNMEAFKRQNFGLPTT